LDRLLLGDRIQVLSARAETDTLILQTVQVGPDDAYCCPGQKLRREFSLTDGKIVETASYNQGRLSIDDLQGQWRLIELAVGKPVSRAITVNIRFDRTRINGSSGCNRYMGLAMPGESPGEIRLSGPLGLTMMACPPPTDQIERDYLSKLQNVQRFAFLGGRLILSWGNEKEQGILIFEKD